MARRKNLTREFDSAIDVDFLKNRILHDAFAKLAAEQDAYNEQMGYPANGTTGELPIQQKFGGRQKFQTGSKQSYIPSAEEIAAWELQYPEYKNKPIFNPNVVNGIDLTGLDNDIDIGTYQNQILQQQMAAAANPIIQQSLQGGIGQIQPLGYPVSNIPDRDQIWNNTNYGSGISGNAGTIGSAGVQAPGVNPYLPKMAIRVTDDSGVATKPAYESTHDKYESAKELLKRLYNTEGYKDTNWDKIGKGMAFAPAALTAIAAMQKDKYPKFPHYTPTDLNIDPVINDLINQGQLNTNNVMDRLRSQSGSAGSYMTNAITASGQSQENTARSIMQLRMEAAARNKAATDQAGQFNAQTDKEQILAQEERKGKRWTDAGNALGLAAANLNSMNKENKMNWAGKEARKDQLAAIYAQMGFGKADIAKLELELGIPPIQEQTGGRLKFNKKQNYFSFL